MVLFDVGGNTYVNRFLPDGTPYENAVGDFIDGTPLFFPIDDFPICSAGELLNCALDDTLHTASIPGEPDTYEPGGWINESPAAMHNFSFSTEVSYFFEWNSAAPPSFDFLGDDDVWVFVNGKLALDLGGKHVPEAAQFTLDAATNTALGLGMTSGNVYPITVFHAERNPTGSSFRLTLSGFRAVRSLCVPNCGDGVVAGSEECDDGENDGGHNECQPGCVLATYCGDGIVNGEEVCDDADPNAPSNCSGCRLIRVL
jgi:fibro-slime domain-containing protein